MRLLEPVLSNPRICKVVHGGGNDVVWLQRDFGLFLVNCFDTEKACQARTLKGCQDDFRSAHAVELLRCCCAAAGGCCFDTPIRGLTSPASPCYMLCSACPQVLGFQQRSLGSLLLRFCGISADKSLGQRADWRQRCARGGSGGMCMRSARPASLCNMLIVGMPAGKQPFRLWQTGPSLVSSCPARRPLPAGLVEYARRDVRHMLHIADCLGEMLLQEPQPQQRVPPALLPQWQQQLGEEAAAEEDAGAAGSDVAEAADGSEEEGSDVGEAAEDVLIELAAAEYASAPAEDAVVAETEVSAASLEAAEADKQPQDQQQQLLLQQEPQPAPPSIVELSPAASQALAAALAPQSRLWRAVQRSQAVTLTLHQPTPPAAAVAVAATGLMRRHILATLEQHARLTAEQLQHLEAVADCVHVLAGWRDAAARAADHGLQCLLPDAVLLQMAQAAASSVDPKASNLRGRAQGLDAQQLLSLLPEAAAAAPVEAAAGASGCECFPGVLQGQAAEVGGVAGPLPLSNSWCVTPAGAAAWSFIRRPALRHIAVPLAACRLLGSCPRRRLGSAPGCLASFRSCCRRRAAAALPRCCRWAAVAGGRPSGETQLPSGSAWRSALLPRPACMTTA